MKIRYSVLVLLIFLLGLTLMVPMRAVSSYLNSIEDVAVESSSGKWWSANLNNIYIGSNSIGDATLSLNFSDLLLGRLEFQVLISSEEINFKGNLGRSLFGETSVKDATFEIDVIKAYNKGKSIPQAISMLKGEINYLRFSSRECISAEGSSLAEVVDLLGIFRRNLSVISKIQCKDQNLEIAFMSQEEGALNGEIIITPELNYQLEARSENITSKIKELTKLRFNQTPSIKSSGSILDLIENL